MKPARLFLCVCLVLVLEFLPGAWTARADNGPHGGYTAVTDACAGCHRAHTAAGTRLLVDAVPALCLTCHGSAATGADTDVSDGVYLERDASAESPAEGAAGRGLRAGGFAFALMDTNLDGSAVSAPVTSGHTVNGAAGTAWGNGAVGSGPGAAFSLTCTNCHDPHGGGAYRILRPIPTASGAGTGVTVPDEALKTYSVADAAGNYMNEAYGTQAAALTNWCTQCHTRYLAGNGSGHTDSGDPIFSYRHNTQAVSCVRCHVAHGTAASMNGYAASVDWPDGTALPAGDARSSLLRLDNRGVCASCHLAADGSITGGCDTCHGTPPPTGAHLTHSGPNAVGYGLTGAFGDASAYQFGCGECHPANIALHQNGTVEVTLSPSGAPPSSLKARNDPAAAFDGSACGGVYCHSGKAVSSGPVGQPLVDSNNQYILDSRGNLVYDPYTVTISRTYRTTPAWFGGSLSGACNDCHDFPPTTTYPQVQAGVGDSHNWIDRYGYSNLHAWNMGFDPLPCRTCHYGEVTQANTWTRVADVTYYDPVPLADKRNHVNGQADVVFDTVNVVQYVGWSGTTTYTLSAVTYDPATQSCSNVGCHKLQTYVEWGSPYRWDGPECDLCHRYGTILPPPLLAARQAHPAAGGQTCVSCHTRPLRQRP